MLNLDYDDLHWQSDWMAEELGMTGDFVVGYYTLKICPEVNLYINAETMEILELWIDDVE